jgi:hypothetical protein
MKKTIQIFIIVFFCSKLSIGQDLRFFYAAPRATMEATFGANNVLGFFRDSAGVQIPQLNGYRYKRIVARNRTAFRNIAPPNIKKTYDSLITSTSTLRRKSNRVLSISKGKINHVEVFMIDDRTFLPGGENWFFCATPTDSGLIAWPCAYNDSLNRYSNFGNISFGERAARSESSFRAWESTLLHGFSHTQLLKRESNTNCKWGNNCVAIAYGGDDGHWFTELQADQQSPLDEGFGNFWALEHEPSLKNYTDSFLADSSYRFILGSHSFLTGVPQMWNAPHYVFGNATVPPRDADGNRNISIINNGNTLDINLVGEHIQTGASYQVRKYKWLDVPGDFVFYNEIMFQAMMYIYHEKAFASKDTSMTKILKVGNYLSPLSDHQRHRYPINVAMKLAKLMEEYASTPVGRREETNNTLVSSLFPIALYDMLTHFGQTDTEFQRELEVANYQVEGITNFGQPRAKAEYLAKRAEIKRLLCPFLSANSECRQANAPIKMDLAISALLTYCRDSSRILR